MSEQSMDIRPDAMGGHSKEGVPPDTSQDATQPVPQWWQEPNWWENPDNLTVLD